MIKPNEVVNVSLTNLHIVGSRWYYDVVGDGHCPISDTWWQTETGGFMITPLPGGWPLKPGSATLPFFGVQPAIVDENGHEISGKCSGYLCIKAAWPGMMRTLQGDHARYETTYFAPFKGFYFSGDGCRRSGSSSPTPSFIPLSCHGIWSRFHQESWFCVFSSHLV
jgi:acyl-coenzyme A synthetase/AMP-(fatty) acid ligase